jgi:hypothetical protein
MPARIRWRCRHLFTALDLDLDPSGVQVSSVQY